MDKFLYSWFTMAQHCLLLQGHSLVSWDEQLQRGEAGLDVTEVIPSRQSNYDGEDDKASEVSPININSHVHWV